MHKDPRRNPNAQFISNEGAGDWAAFSGTLDSLLEAADGWSRELEGVEKPWLCWNVSANWCVLQQRLVQEVGWTPVVGLDPRYPAPPLVPGAHLIDFNEPFGFEIMYFHFPLELMFRFADRLAFWHSDLLCRRETMEYLAETFEGLEDGSMAAVHDMGGLRNILAPKRHRYWELAGCTTRGASRSQFENGAGWWRPFHLHPNCPPEEREERSTYHGDHGFGIMYWKRHCGGSVVDLKLKRLIEGHCTSIGHPDYQRLAPDGPRRDMGAEIDMNYDIEKVARHLGIEDLLQAESSV